MHLLRHVRMCLRPFLRRESPRQVPRRSAKPRIGSYVVHVQGALRLLTQAGMSDDLWVWLMNQGWRVEHYRPDRRAYRHIPASYVTRLIDADPSQWERLMIAAIQYAEYRPAGGRTDHRDYTVRVR